MTIYSLVGGIALAALLLTIIRRFVQKPSNLLVGYLQDFVGAFFIFSGAVKAIDPLGTAYKMGDYLAELDLGFLEGTTVFAAVFMIVLEFVLGIALILGYRKKLTLAALLLVIIFFTFLTGYTYLTGWTFGSFSPSDWSFNKLDMKVTDCGCFGDFLKLEPKISFFKDIFLTIFILIMIWQQRHIKPLLVNVRAALIVAVFTIGSFFYCISNFVWDLPQFDFRPYKPGKSIVEQMDYVAPTVKYKFFYKNKNTGEEVGYVHPEKPTGDEWERVSGKREDIVVDPGVPAVISNWQIVDADGNVMDDEILYNPDYVLMVVAYKLEETHKEAFTEKLNPIAAAAEKDNLLFFTVTASDSENFRHDVQASYPFFSADATFLKTIIRSNPGLVVIKDGTVVAKFHHKHLPTYEELKAKYLK